MSSPECRDISLARIKEQRLACEEYTAVAIEERRREQTRKFFTLISNTVSFGALCIGCAFKNFNELSPSAFYRVKDLPPIRRGFIGGVSLMSIMNVYTFSLYYQINSFSRSEIHSRNPYYWPNE